MASLIEKTALYNQREILLSHQHNQKLAQHTTVEIKGTINLFHKEITRIMGILTFCALSIPINHTHFYTKKNIGKFNSDFSWNLQKPKSRVLHALNSTAPQRSFHKKERSKPPPRPSWRTPPLLYPKPIFFFCKSDNTWTLIT